MVNCGVEQYLFVIFQDQSLLQFAQSNVKLKTNVRHYVGSV
jgi:hypothetical protein